MIIKLALIAIKKIPQVEHPVEESLDDANKVVHLSRPTPGKLKAPISIIS